jgi:hypothetical protein
MAIGPIVYPTIPATSRSLLHITAATIVKASPGVIGTVSVVVAGSGNGALHDCLTTGAASATNKIAVVLDTATAAYTLNFPCRTGICVVPGTGQTLSVSFA